MPPAAFIAAATPAYSAPGSTTIITVLTPPTTQAGDAMLWFVWSGAATGEVDAATLPAGWSVISHFVAGGGQPITLLRRIATDNEPAQHTIQCIPGSFATSALGVLLVYRGLDNAAPIVDAAAAQVIALSLFTCPSLTLTTYSDIYIGIVAYFAPTATTVDPIPAGAIERYDQPQTTAGGGKGGVEVFDLQIEAVGPTGTQGVGLNAARTGVAVAFALRAVPPMLAPSITPDIPGAIGFVTVGV